MQYIPVNGHAIFLENTIDTIYVF